MMTRDTIKICVIVRKLLQIFHELVLFLKTRQYITVQEVQWYFQGMLGIKRKYMKENLN